MQLSKSYLLLALFALILFAGCAGSYLMKGNHYYDSMAYSKAVPKYEKALSKKDFPQAKHNLADAYRRMNNSVEAEKWYRAVDSLPDVKPIEVLYYGQSMMKNGNYAGAKAMLKQYLAKSPNDKAAATMLASCDSVDAFKKDSARYVVEQLSINSGSSMSPVIYNNGVVFASDRGSSKKPYAWTGRPYLDLYYSKDNGEGNLQAPELLKGSVNGIYHDGPATFSPDGNTIYFTRDNYLKKKTGESADDVVLLKIYQATKNSAGEWQDIKELPFNSKDYSCGHPSMSSDGKTMYFVSDMPGGQGGTDIYTVRKDGDQWGTPVNMGPTINTPMNEMFPNIYKDSTLYFSSEGHINLGGLDVFETKTDGKTWSEPKNLKYPINTSKDDFGYLPEGTGEKGYFTSNRESADGSIDKIYRFSKPEPKFALEGIVVSKKTQAPIPDATVTLVNKKTGKSETARSDKDGKFAFTLNANTDYSVSGIKDGYFSQTENITTLGKDPTVKIFVKLELDEIEINKPIVVKNIYYDFDKADIRPDAAKELDNLVQTLNDNPTIKIELSSHADCRGTDPYNNRLTQRRAQSAVDYIVKHGIAKDRITAKGYGKTMPVVKCDPCESCSEDQHQQNRRTEFKVLGFTTPPATK